MLPGLIQCNTIIIIIMLLNCNLADLVRTVIKRKGEGRGLPWSKVTTSVL